MFPMDEIDPYIAPTGMEEESPGKVLKKAVGKTKKSAGGTLTDTVQQETRLPNAIESYRSRATDLFRQGAELMDKDPDMSQMQAFARQRGEQGSSAMLNALAAQYAGESFKPIQAQFLKRAAEAADPLKVGSGYLTNDGQYIKDPEVAQTRKAEFLLQQAKAYEQMAATAQTAQERAEAQRMQNETLNQLRLMGLQVQQMNAQTARMNATGAGGMGGSFSPSGKTPDGKNIVTNTRSGLQYLVEANPDGTPMYTPYRGASIPNASYEKQVTEATDLSGNVARADNLIKQVQEFPQAFGLRGAAVSSVPGSVQGYAAKAAGLTPQQLLVRATVLKQAAAEINQLYGAALSMGEQARANTFLPNPGDPPDVLIAKLQAGRDWAAENLNRMPPGVRNSVQARTAPAAAQPQASSAGGLTPQEMEELQRLRQKHGRQ